MELVYYYKVKNISNKPIELPVSKRTIYPGAIVTISESAYNWIRDDLEVIDIIKKEKINHRR